MDPEMNDQEESDDQDNMNDREVVDDQPDQDCKEDDDQEDDENPDGVEEDEKGADPGNEDSNEIDNGDGGNPSSAAKETEKEQTSDNNNNPTAANNPNTTAPPPSQPPVQQQPQQKAKPMIQSAVVAPLNGNEANVSALKKESVPPPRELEEQPQVNNASDAPPKKQPQTQPEMETRAKSISSVKEKAPCPSSAVPLPTPEDDATTLYRAFKGKGCDVGKVVQILAQRDSTHRYQIAQLYKKNYDEELSDRISSEFSRMGDLKEQVGVDLTVNPTGSFSLFCSNIKRAISLWLMEESERDATIVWLSLQLTSFDKAALTEVICSRTPSQLRSLKQAYFTKYGSRLLEDISASTFRFYGYHKELLIACLDDKTARDEGTNVDPKMAEEDAKQLYKDGEKIWGTNEKTFVEIFTQRNRPHLAAVDVAYEKLYGHSLEEAVKNETTGSFEAGLVTLLRCAKNSAKYFAEVLYNSMKGLGTSNAILLRTVVTKAGSTEMEDIKKEYSVAYKISLLDAIHKDTSGHYRTFLVNLVE